MPRLERRSDRNYTKVWRPAGTPYSAYSVVLPPTDEPSHTIQEIAEAVRQSTLWAYENFLVEFSCMPGQVAGGTPVLETIISNNQVITTLWEVPDEV